MKKCILFCTLINLYFFTAAQGPELRIPAGHSKAVNAVAISPDSKLVATAGQDNQVVLWDAATGADVRNMELDMPVHQLFFSPSGAFLFTGSGAPESVLRKWDVKTGRLLFTYPFSFRKEYFISPDGKFFLAKHLTTVAGGTGTPLIARLLDTASRRGDNNNFYKNYLAESAWKLWNLEKNEPVKTVYFTGEPVGFYMENGTPLVLTKAQRMTEGYQFLECIDIWDIGKPVFIKPVMNSLPYSMDTLKPLRRILPYYNAQYITSCTGCILFISETKQDSLQVWDTRNGKIQAVFKGSGHLTGQDALSADESTMAALNGAPKTESVDVWSLKNGYRMSHVILPENFHCNSLKLSPDGRFYVIAGHVYAQDNLVYIYNAGGRLLHQLQGNASEVRKYSFSADGRYVYTDNAFLNPGAARTENISDRMMQIARKSGLTDDSDDDSSFDIMMKKVRSASGSDTSGAFSMGDMMKTVGAMQNNAVKELKATFTDADKPTANMRVWDLVLGNTVSYKPAGIEFGTDTVSADKNYLLTSSYKHTGFGENMKAQYGDVSNNSFIGRMMSTGRGDDFDFSSVVNDQNSSFNRTFSQVAKLVNRKTRDTIFLIALDSADWIMVNRDGYYMSSRNAAKKLHYIFNNEVFYFDQFDLQFNRPDKVLESIGLSSPEIINAYRKAYLKRVATLGMDTSLLNSRISFNAPEVGLGGKENSNETSASRILRFPVEATDKKYALSTVNIAVNGVPDTTVYLKPGNRVKSAKLTAALELSAGDNIIEVSAMNEKGVSGLTRRFNVFYPGGSKKPDLYVICIGAGKYANASMNLGYAEKDARDVLNQFTLGVGHYNFVHKYFLAGAQVTPFAVRELKTVLQGSSPDDRVVIFYAGHGLFDKNFDYYLGAYNMDFSNPASGGIKYDEFENLLSGIPAREKLLLIDACHSGEIDRENLQVSPVAADGSGKILRRGGEVVGPKGTGLSNSFELMKQLFTDIRHSTGTAVIAAAGGAEFAFEGGRWNNGVFTYCLLKGLQEKKADLDGDGLITVSELRDYLQQNVSLLTKGAQIPVSRSENLVNNFFIW